MKQLVVPENLLMDIFKAYHENLGHQGGDRTSIMKLRVVWSGMESFVSDKIEERERCTRRKVLPRRAADMVSIGSTAPMEVDCLECLTLERSKGCLGNILVISDHYTGYAQAIPRYRNK